MQGYTDKLEFPWLKFCPACGGKPDFNYGKITYTAEVCGDIYPFVPKDYKATYPLIEVACYGCHRHAEFACVRGDLFDIERLLLTSINYREYPKDLQDAFAMAALEWNKDYLPETSSRTYAMWEDKHREIILTGLSLPARLNRCGETKV